MEPKFVDKYRTVLWENDDGLELIMATEENGNVRYFVSVRRPEGIFKREEITRKLFELMREELES